MTQFASTLYPQTNPSNPILLAYRDGNVSEAQIIYTSLMPLVGAWVGATQVRRDHVFHAQRVISRLAALSG